MTITLVSGKTMEFDNVWVKYPIMDLPNEHQKIVIEKIKKELPADTNLYTIDSDFYCAGGRNWITKEKFEDHALVIPREEAERIIKDQYEHIVWVDFAMHLDKNRRYWTASNYAFEHWGKNFAWKAWSPIDAKGLIDPEDHEVDTDMQRLVHDFYQHGGKEGALKYYEEKLALIVIPQLSGYWDRHVSKQDKPNPEPDWLLRDYDHWADDDPLEIKKEYMEIVRGFVHEWDHLEKMKEQMSDWKTDKWRIVQVPTGGESIINPHEQYLTPKVTTDQIKNGDDLRKWLSDNFLSQAKAAELCGVPARTFRRWLAGEPFIPKGALELLLKKIQDR